MNDNTPQQKSVTDHLFECLASPDFNKQLEALQALQRVVNTNPETYAAKGEPL